MSLTELQQANLKIAALASVRCEYKYEVPAALSLAQWVQESGWGEHAPGCNCFGIKRYEGCHGVQSLQTVEFEHGVQTVLQQEFATFNSINDCFDYHAALLARGKRYASAMAAYRKNDAIASLVLGIAPIYAPGNLDYSTRILTLISDGRLVAALKEAHTIYGIHSHA